jgi:hypothetical protein
LAVQHSGEFIADHADRSRSRRLELRVLVVVKGPHFGGYGASNGCVQRVHVIHLM